MTPTDHPGRTGTTGTVGGTGAVSIDGVSGGVAFVPQVTPLIRLNYYDGKFLRADDLTLEQRGQRMLVHLSNQASGPGVVHGLDVSVASGPTLVLSGGLGIDPAGRVLFLPETVEVPIADLLDAARDPAGAPAGGTNGTTSGGAGSAFARCEAVQVAGGPNDAPVIAGVQLFLVAVAHAEALCGHEDVLGRLCSSGCETPQDRPYRNEGVVLLLRPLPLTGLLPPATGGITFTDTHLRSRAASAWFAQERADAGSWLSAARLRTPVWCRGASLLGGDVVPVGVLGWRGSAVVFFDPWTVRRERMEAPPRAYWAGRSELRPWPVFLAQVLQFQCQYAELPARPGGGGTGTDPCAPSKDLLVVSTRLVDALAKELQGLGWTGDTASGARDDTGGDTAEAGAGFVLNAAVLQQFQQVAAATLTAPAAPESGSTLVDGGIVELPAAGYLPVDHQSAASLRAQLEPVFGSGVDLRICAVRRDQIPHELERAQHMDRISLLAGRGDPALVEPVDVLVPDGTTTEVTEYPKFGFAVDLSVGFGEGQPDAALVAMPGRISAFQELARAEAGQVLLRGVGRLHPAPEGGTAHLAAIGSGAGLRSMLRLMGTATGDTAAAAVSLATGLDVEAVAVWATARTARDPFAVAAGESFAVSGDLDASVPDSRPAPLEFRLGGQAQVRSRQTSGTTVILTLHLDVQVSRNAVNVRDVKDAGRPVQFDVQLRRVQRAGRTILQLSDAAQVQIPSWEASLAWSGTPVAADAVVHQAVRGEAERRIAEGHALQDPAVNQPAGEYHGLAVDALKILQSAKPGDPLFLDSALRALFPPGGPTRTEVHPTTDWVLFRRRRSLRCDDVATQPPVKTSSVATFVTRADSQKRARALTDMLRAGTGGQVPWTASGIAEFTTGTDTLLNAASTVEHGYRDARGGPRLAFVGYGAAIPGDPTGIGRARALVGTLASTVTLDNDAIDLVLDPPADRFVPGTEASVFFVSYDEVPVVTDCVEVLNLDEVDTPEGADLLGKIRNGDVPSVDAARLLQRLGHVPFTAGEPDQTKLEEIKQKLLAKDPRSPRAIGWIAADLSAEQSAEKQKQIEMLRDKYQLPLEQVLRVGFAGGGCRGRLYVLQLYELQT